MNEPFVHIIDDDAAFLLALSRLLRASGFAVRTYMSASEFLARRDTDEPGCVVVDLHMPEVGGLDLQSALGQSLYPLPVLFLTGQPDTESTVLAIRNGAEDFLEKRASKEHLLDAVQRALARDLRERGARARKHELRFRFDSISRREREVLDQVLQGKMNKQIAACLGIHERTVKMHRKAIMTKLGVRSVAALTRLTEQAEIPLASASTRP